MNSGQTSCHDNLDDASLATVSDVTYLVLADSLAEQIADMAPGTRLPSENELITEHGVSRITARAALSELEQRHLVRRARGSGTHRQDSPPMMMSGVVLDGATKRGRGRCAEAG